jgi:hypothetical protein
VKDCAWCGNGEGICDECMAEMFAQSTALAATGRYLATKGEGQTTTQTEENEVTSPS